MRRKEPRGDGAGPVTVHQRFAVGGGFAFDDFGFELTEIQVKMETVSLLGRHVAVKPTTGKIQAANKSRGKEPSPTARVEALSPFSLRTVNSSTNKLTTVATSSPSSLLEQNAPLNASTSTVRLVVYAKRFLTEGQLGLNLALGHPFNHTERSD